MYEQKTVREVLDELDSASEKGLTEKEAAKRLKQYGQNRLAQAKKKTVAESFLEQLNEPLIFVLFVAAAISMLLHEFNDAIIILVVIAVNASVGVVQEGKAQKALDALKKLTSPKAVVRRDGIHKEIPAAELVPGDIVCLDAGRQIPADLRLIRDANLKIEEAALTGESVPVEKSSAFVAGKQLSIGDCKNMAFMSTSVTNGRGEGIVTATGMMTEIGRIAGMIGETPEEATPLQKRLADLGKLLSIVAVFLCIALFVIAVWQKRNIFEMLITAISLAVAAVPEGLPAVVTIVLALSVSRMVKVHTIVRRLPSVETLGAVSIVCSDKTGTLTQNKMKVMKAFINQRLCDAADIDVQRQKEFFEGFVLCNDAWVSKAERMGDPTELALLDMAFDKNIAKKELEEKRPRIGEIPFDSDRKMMTTLHRSKNGYLNFTKGAADEIIKRCNSVLINQKKVPLTSRYKKEIERAVGTMSGQALRVLALAYCTDTSVPRENGLTFIGLAGMIDPPRPEAAKAVEQFKYASVKTVMITGDHIDTAYAIAKQLGIASEFSSCISGEMLEELSEEELLKKLPYLTVFARVSPEHKVRIVKAFKELGNIVAMTGDGVNDAPSLKTADIGIAMGMSGTDVAKNASDIILTDDNFATIEKAIEEGRGIYENIKKSILFLLSSNFGEIITMFFAIIAGFAAPLKASHILWINLITDSLPALALGVDSNDAKSLMSHPPRKPKESLFAHGGLACTLFYGCLIAGISLAAFLKGPCSYLISAEMEINLVNIRMALSDVRLLNRSQTYAFTVLGLSQLFHAVGMRNVEKSIFTFSVFSNKLMLAACVIGALLQIMVTEIPRFITAFGTVSLSLAEWGHLLCLAAVPLIAHEFLILISHKEADESKQKSERQTTLRADA